MKHDIDYIALSFVREASDVEACRALLGRKANTIKVIAKIEDQEGVTHIHDIVRTADGVMVARGDLGIETNIADLPNIQRRIVHSAARWGRRSVVATQCLNPSSPHPDESRGHGRRQCDLRGRRCHRSAKPVLASIRFALSSLTSRGLWPGLGYEKDLEPESDKQHIATNALLPKT